MNSLIRVARIMKPSHSFETQGWKSFFNVQYRALVDLHLSHPVRLITQLLPSSVSSLLRRGFSKRRCKHCCCHQELWSRNCKNSGILQEESLPFVKYHSKCAVNYVQNITCQSKCSVLLENWILISKCFLSKSPKICTWLKVLFGTPTSPLA